MPDNQVQRQLEKAIKLYDSGQGDACYRLLLGITAKQAVPNTPQFQKDYYLYKGFCEIDKGEYNEAEASMLLSLAACRTLGITKNIYGRLDNLASIQMGKNNFSKAIEYVHQSIALKEADDNHQALALGYIQLSQLFFTIESYAAGKQALEKAGYYIRHFRLSEYARYWHFINGKQLKREGQYAAAIKAYTQSAKYAVRFNDNNSLMAAIHNRGEIFLHLKQWSKAEKDYREALRLVRLHRLSAHEPTMLISLAGVLLQKQDFAGCLKLLKELEPLLKDSQDAIVLRDYEELLAKYYKVQGQHQQALLHYEAYLQHYRSTYNKELSNSLLDLQAKYESEKRERELQQAQLQRTESELKALRAQMNPHFIFNALNGIRKELLKGNTETADEYMLRFSRLLRLILNSTRTPLMKLNENLEMLDLYIQIEQARQNQRFGYHIKISPLLHPENLYVPGMLLQPIVENAIVHGLYHRETTGGLLTIQCAKKKDYLQITVTDNGVGRTKTKSNSQHQSHALNMIRETLVLAWGNSFSEKHFIITDLTNKAGQPTGTKVTVTIPLHLKP